MTHFLPCKEKLESPETPVGVENTGVRGSSVDKALLTALLNWRPILRFVSVRKLYIWGLRMGGRGVRGCLGSCVASPSNSRMPTFLCSSGTGTI